MLERFRESFPNTKSNVRLLIGDIKRNKHVFVEDHVVEYNIGTKSFYGIAIGEIELPEGSVMIPICKNAQKIKHVKSLSISDIVESYINHGSYPYEKFLKQLFSKEKAYLAEKEKELIQFNRLPKASIHEHYHSYFNETYKQEDGYFIAETL